MRRLFLCFLLLCSSIDSRAQFTGVNIRPIVKPDTSVQIYSDLFVYSPGELSAVSSGNWSTSDGVMNVSSGHTLTSGQQNVFGAYTWNGTGVFTPNQYSTMVIAKTGSSDFGAVVRGTIGGGDTYYSTDCASTIVFACRLVKIVAGTQTNLTTYGAQVNVGDTIRLEVSGTTTTTLVLKHNGLVYQTITDTNSPILSGKPGLTSYGNDSTSTAISKTSGGNF